MRSDRRYVRFRVAVKLAFEKLDHGAYRRRWWPPNCGEGRWFHSGPQTAQDLFPCHTVVGDVSSCNASDRTRESEICEIVCGRSCVLVVAQENQIGHAVIRVVADHAILLEECTLWILLGGT